MYWQLHAYRRKIIDAELSCIRSEGERKVRVVVVYPNRYGVGMANLGYQFAFFSFSQAGGVLVDRAFYPSKTERYFMEKSGSPLSSWEYDIPLKEFDLIAFSISFEMDYFKFLRILDMADVPVERKKRGDADPLVAVGGAVTFFNPFPLSMFVDFFVVGEAEEVIPTIVEILAKRDSKRRSDILSELSMVEGIYVPGVSDEVKRLKLREIDKGVAFSPIISPYSEWGRMLLIEITRGCVFGCAFCVVSSCYAPYRYRDAAIIESIMHSMKDKVGRVGFVSAVPMLHPQIGEISKKAVEMGFRVSYSSIRIDLLNEELVRIIVDSGHRSITFAPETGGDSLRFSINKRFTNKVILDKLRMSYELGIRHFKMYFIIGLPGETESDICKIYELCESIIESLKGNVTLTVSVTTFIPKPFAIFEGSPFMGIEEISRRQAYLKRLFKPMKRVKLVMDRPQSAAMQALFSRGGEDIGKVLVDSYHSGGYNAVLKACRRHDVDVDAIFNGTSERVWYRIIQ